jgi:hypothetical protein
MAANPTVAEEIHEKAWQEFKPGYSPTCSAS